MFHNPIDYFLSVRLKIFIFQILQLGRTPNEFRRKPIPSPRVLEDFIAQNSFRWRKEEKNLHCQLSIFKESTEKQRQMIYSISIFLFSGLTCGVFWCFFYPSFFSMFFWTLLVYFLHNLWVIHTSPSIYLGFDIFSSTEKLRWRWRPQRRRRQCKVR